MGWLLGRFFSQSRADVTAVVVPDLMRRAAYVCNAPTAAVVAGGLDETCQFGSAVVDGNECAWSVVGIAFRREGACVRALDASDWSRVLAEREPQLDSLDGHFAAVRWGGGEVSCFVDQLGMRVLYAAETDGDLIISTRLDWLVAAVGTRDIDYSALGGHWLLFNQFATGSLIRGVQRLGQGGTLVWNRERLTITERPWLPDGAADSDGLPAVLEAFLRPTLRFERRPSLGLSGGFDSRVLLALALGGGLKLDTHVFGDDSDADVRISRSIAARVGIRQVHLTDDGWDTDACIQLLREIAATSCAVEPVSVVRSARWCAELEARRAAIVDGGLGEIARRAYLKRLALRGGGPIRRRDAAGVLPFVQYDRADVFNGDALRVMRSGAREQVQRALDALPPIGEIDEDDVVDLLAVRTRFPNYAGYEQSRSDAACVSFMPFAQPSVLRLVFASRGRAMRRIISSRAPLLTRFPLVKGDSVLPYRVPCLAAAVWRKISRQFSPVGGTHPAVPLLDLLEGFVRDTAASSTVRSFEGYDTDKIDGLIGRYYAGNRTLAAPLAWWLSLELWRQSVSRGRAEARPYEVDRTAVVIS